jgi:toxin-antitoxin system PIN domain toxin
MGARAEIWLVDVNVLFALLWPRHVHHGAATEWFATQGNRGWATNPITELGVLRLLTNPAVTRSAVNAATALRVLAEATAHPNHEFWSLDRSIAVMIGASGGGVSGHRQWTDAVLLTQAFQRKGRLVTFDAGIESVADAATRGHLTVLGR